MSNLKDLKKIIAKKNPLWISFVILFSGILITLLFSNYVRLEDESRTQREFEQVCNEIKSKIITHIGIQTEFLISGSSLFEASNEVTREEWSSFNKFSTTNVKFLGVQALGFCTIIKKSEVQKHLASIQKGFPNYKIFPAQDRAIYTSIIYVEPFNQTNAVAFGYDMFLEPVRRKAMQNARDYDRPTISDKVTLLVENKNKPQAGIVIYVPVYKAIPLNTIESRRKAITGWIFCTFRMDDLMKSIWKTSYMIDKKNIFLKIYDNGIISQKSLLFDSQNNNLKEDQQTKTRSIPVFFNDKKWTLVFSLPAESGFSFSTKVLIIFIGGLIISLLLSALFYSLLITKKRARIIATHLSSDLLHKNKEYEKINKMLKKNYKKLNSSKEKLDSINKELEKAKVKAEESDQLKSAFLANMSHEIRTPMNGIMGFTELLKEANISLEEHKNYIEIIEKSGTRLLNIINDIVDVSKIEAGLMQVSLSAVNIDHQIQYIESFFRPEAQDKNIQIIIQKNAIPYPTIINTDSEKLYAILINLVKNAIKYTVQGTIELGYEIKSDYIKFFVKDTGIGISVDRQIAIFERFIQADFNDKMARQGAGLGLAIAKAYVELLGGKIWVESQPDKGSTFYFTIANGTKVVNNYVAENNVPLYKKFCEVKNLKILVAEDDSISRMLILKVLEEYGSQILIAQTGLEAVEICRKNPDLDLILMDIQMPIMNGYEATREIKKFNTKAIILAQTAFALEGDEAKTLEAGCHGYISKPIKKEELSNLLQFFFCK